MNSRIATTICLGLTVLAAGCGKREGQLSGTVTFRGKPLPNGEMLLTGDESRGNGGPGVMVEIKNGTFRTPSERGHWGGPYLATITAYKGETLLIANYEMPIDLPEGNATYDIVIPDEAGVKGAPGD